MDKRIFRKLLTAVPLLFFLASCEKNDLPGGKNLSDEEIYDRIPVVLNTAYYKDIFLDGGCRLNPGIKVDGEIVNGQMPYALEKLKLSYEFFISSEDNAFATTSPLADEVQKMNDILSGSKSDPNGVLLYPDGEPRFRAVFIFGGFSTGHAELLTDAARNNVKTFFKNGGSYVGSCAGAYLAGLYSDGEERPYFNIWTGGNMIYTELNSSSTSMIFPLNSPLLRYSDFGNDGMIENVRHNGGGYMDENSAPEGTEILARFGTCPGGSTSAPYYDKVSTWAYKESDESGRLVVCGSHPEDAPSGEVLDFTNSMFSYAIDGSGCAKVKDILHDGECKSTNLIGDMQCHHFVFYLPEDASVKIELDGEPEAGLQLFLKKETFAFPENEPEYSSSMPDSMQQIITTNILESGLWFVTVRCNARIKSDPVVLNKSLDKGMYFEYSGYDKVLSGVPYSLKFNIVKGKSK